MESKFTLQGEKELIILDNSAEKLYVFAGFGIEYVLNPLANYFRNQGLDVIEIDMYNHGNTTVEEHINEIRHRQIVFITSWHLFFDQHNFEPYNKMKKKVMSPLELMSALNPLKSYYYPHDLACYLHPIEYKWIDLFDAFLVPKLNKDTFRADGLTDIVEVGWIKKNIAVKGQTIDSNNISALYLPSNIEYSLSKYTPREYVDTWKPFVGLGIAVKLPIWDGLDEVCTIAKEEGFTLIDGSISLFSILLEYNLIIGNGTSSVIYETALSGIPIISLMDGAESDTYYKSKLPSGVITKTIEEAADYIKDIRGGRTQLHYKEDLLKPFDFDLAFKTITG